jgi:hypothetical protein
MFISAEHAGEPLLPKELLHLSRFLSTFSPWRVSV